MDEFNLLEHLLNSSGSAPGGKIRTGTFTIDSQTTDTDIAMMDIDASEMIKSALVFRDADDDDMIPGNLYGALITPFNDGKCNRAFVIVHVNNPTRYTFSSETNAAKYEEITSRPNNDLIWVDRNVGKIKWRIRALYPLTKGSYKIIAEFF